MTSSETDNEAPQRFNQYYGTTEVRARQAIRVTRYDADHGLSPEMEACVSVSRFAYSFEDVDN